MKAFMLTGIRRMELREAPQPKIAHDRDVLVRMGAVGVCGSDIHYYTTGRIGSQVVQYPFTVGHECAGVVADVGAKVTRVKPGDRVAIEPAMHCGACDQCRAGRPNTCRRLRFLGCPGQASGSLAEYLVLPEECCIPLRPETTLAQGVISEPLAIGVYAVQQSVPMSGARIGILGFGPIGMSVLWPALAQGAEQVYVTDKIPARLARARDNGAAWAGNPDAEDVVAEISKREPLLLDAVFECCGMQEACDDAVELLKPGGKIMLIGIPEAPRISFQIDKMRRKEACIQNVRRQKFCVEPALDLIENRKVEADRMITHRFRFEQTAAAFELVAGYGDGVMKALILFDGVE